MGWRLMGVMSENKTQGHIAYDSQDCLFLSLRWKLLRRPCERVRGGVLGLLPEFGLLSFRLLFLAALFLCGSGLRVVKFSQVGCLVHCRPKGEPVVELVLVVHSGWGKYNDVLISEEVHRCPRSFIV